MTSYIKLTELQQYMKYDIAGFNIEHTPFGNKVLIYFANGDHAYLPPRFKLLSMEDIDDLNKIDVSIMRTGTRESSFDSPMADFLFFSNYEESTAFLKLNEINITERPYVDWKILRRDKIFKVEFSKIINSLGPRNIVRFEDQNWAIFPETVQDLTIDEMDKLNQEKTFIKVGEDGFQFVDRTGTPENKYESCYKSIED